MEQYPVTLRTIMKLNNDFLTSMKEVLSKNEYDLFIKSLTEKPKRAIVVNNLKIDKSSFLHNFNYELENLELDQNCFKLNTDEKLGNSLLHKAGAFYLQEPSAMVPALLLPLKSGDRVLDVCASPGGKSFQIARRLDGVLVSNEIDFDRAKKLQSNLERLGVCNSIITNFDSKGLSESYPNCFDCLIVDAPCSGEGMFRRDEFAVNQWTLNLVENLSKLQLEILANVDNCLKEGGYLVYSTCTFSIEENEKIVAQLVDMGYVIQALPVINGAVDGVKLKGYTTNLAKRIYPHNDLGEGQFVCLLQKQKCCEGRVKSFELKVNLKEKKIVEEFFTENLIKPFDFNKEIVIKDSQVYFCADKNLIRKSNIINYGVKLGQIEKSRFEPHNNFFSAFGQLFNRKIELTEAEALKVMRGETIYSSCDNGWCALSFKGCFFAGGKAVNGLVKNHYPKGLRLN